jgi:hypothetical protein
LTLADGETLELAAGGSIVAAGTGKVELVNTTFQAGTYTAAGAVEIAALTAGDTIKTGTTATDGLTFAVAASDTIALTSTGAAAATYTFAAVGTSGEKITFSKLTSEEAGITIPGHATNTAANFTVPVGGTVVIGQGTKGGAIVLGSATNGGILTTANGSVIKGIVIVNADTTDGTGIGITGVTVTTAAAAQNATAAASDGSLVTTTGGTFKATATNGTNVKITKATSATIGST